MSKLVYVVERNGVVKDNDPSGRLTTSAFRDLRGVQAWHEITPFHFFQVEAIVPYVSVEALEALPNKTPELEALIQWAKLGVPEKVAEVKAIPDTMKLSSTVHLHKGGWGASRTGIVIERKVNKTTQLYIQWTDQRPYTELLKSFSAVLCTSLISVSHFLEIMRESNAEFDGLRTYHL